MTVTPPHPKALFSRRLVFRMSDENAVNFQQEMIDLLVKYQSMETTAEDTYYSALLALFPSNMPYEPSKDDPVQEDAAK